MLLTITMKYGDRRGSSTWNLPPIQDRQKDTGAERSQKSGAQVPGLWLKQCSSEKGTPGSIPVSIPQIRIKPQAGLRSYEEFVAYPGSSR
jgi:hypothetical protein